MFRRERLVKNTEIVRISPCHLVHSVFNTINVVPGRRTTGMEKKKDLIMVAVVTLVAIGVLLSVTVLVRGVMNALTMAFGG
jgi:hypothetical protein